MSLPKPYYQSDRVTLYCGDCLSILPHLSGVDCVLTDPPYGIEYLSGMRTDRSARFDPIAGDKSVAVRDAAMDLVAARSAILFGTWKAPKPNGVYATLVWNKGVHVGMGDLDFPWKLTHEEVYFIGDKRAFSGHRDGSVLTFPALYPNLPAANLARGEAFEHPTQKPTKLIEHLLGKCEGHSILDPFMGSGTTGVAAIRLGRKFIGIEIDEKYCAIAKRRIMEAEEVGQMFKNAEAETQPTFFEDAQ